MPRPKQSKREPEEAEQNLSLPVGYVVGDLLWSKITGHPYWPCMVTYDPVQGIFSKVVPGGHQVYHVQYFGKNPERGWTVPNYIVEYKGEQHFADHVSSLSAKLELEKTPPGFRKQKLAKFCLKMSKCKARAWKFAVEEADAALSLTGNARLESFVFKYSSYAKKNVKSAIQGNAAPINENMRGSDSEDANTENIENVSQNQQNKKRKSANSENLENVSQTKQIKKQKSTNSENLENISQNKQNKKHKTTNSENLKNVSQNKPKKKKKKKSTDTKNSKNVTKKKKRESARDAKKNLCSICEKLDGDIVCTGDCKEWFHKDCLGLITVSKSFMCFDCTNNQHTCFSCKSKVGLTKKCHHHSCGKYYHIACMEKYRVVIVAGGKFICPLHFCHTCFSENPLMIQTVSSNRAKCVRCPVAYHRKEACLGAGSVSITKFFLLCPQHIEIEKNEKATRVISISWCSSCGQNKSKEDELNVSCVTCPIVIHKKCLSKELTDDERKNFKCEDCVLHKHFKYGILVWVRVGAYRWWPARILFRKEVPHFLHQAPHGVGQFPVKFCGTEEYYWAHRGITIEYCEEDKEVAMNQSVFAKKTMTGYRREKYINALLKSIKCFDEIAAARKLQDKNKRDFKLIRSNRRVGKVSLDTGQPPCQCNCDPNSQFPCDYNTACLNRSMYFECHPHMCLAKEKCCNQKFTKRQYPSLAEFETDDRGNGLKTLEDIKEGEFVIEYVGDVIDEKEFNERLDDKHEVKDQKYYFLKVNRNTYIDAGPCGNMSRFMNHSCSPNCETQKWSVNGYLRIGFFAIKDIPADTELTFDYSWSPLNNQDLECLCGSENCRGFIGEKHKKKKLEDNVLKCKKQSKKHGPIKKKRGNNISEKSATRKKLQAMTRKKLQAVTRKKLQAVTRKKLQAVTRIKSKLSNKKNIENNTKSIAIVEEDADHGVTEVETSIDKTSSQLMVLDAQRERSETFSQEDADHDITECVIFDNISNQLTEPNTQQKRQNSSREDLNHAAQDPLPDILYLNEVFDDIKKNKEIIRKRCIEKDKDYLEKEKKVEESKKKLAAVNTGYRECYNFMKAGGGYENQYSNDGVTKELKRLKGYIFLEDRHSFCYLCKQSLLNEKEEKIFRCEENDCLRSFHFDCVGWEYVTNLSKYKFVRRCPAHECSFCDNSEITKCELCNFAVCEIHAKNAAFVYRGCKTVCEFHNLPQFDPDSDVGIFGKPMCHMSYMKSIKRAKYRPAKAGMLVNY